MSNRLTQHLVATASLVLAVSGCEPAEERGAREATESYLEAWTYQDAAALHAAHASSTELGTYCASEAFASLHDSVKRSVGAAPRTCAQAESLTRAEGASDEEALMGQLVRFVCERPEGTCRDYQRLVFDGQLEQSAEWSEALAGWEVASVRVEGARASARVSLEHACCAGPVRKTLELEKSVSGWKIAGPPLPLLTRKQ